MEEKNSQIFDSNASFRTKAAINPNRCVIKVNYFVSEGYYFQKVQWKKKLPQIFDGK